MTDPMSQDEANSTATRIIAANAEANLRFQYWFSLLLFAAAVVTAPVVTVCSAYFHFVQGTVRQSDFGQFGVAMMFAWGFFAATGLAHWSARSVAKRAGMKMRF